ncbi:MAG: 1-acyl-sn-glycerol-3-phosphate acyltransferase [Deltaproteobacteria bacterium CG17_big_fil_post_rev_8_21_14_2_50_51_6]|nr:MAG: 1-acyl-sn-glycerol-3-phosphate acyltransferase [Deltaproteobacteria bacterium CG17_big_fil_post_rev_8_21_14_2_50_51_6]PIY22974.1 MAG: 1-acyl-sn-glycerol-3-phosphate acyltransferase [Deltaproteobacteria bacterium CG_4_10_14_3_um_filter_51_14]
MVRSISLNAFIALYTVMIIIAVLLIAPFDGSGRLIHRYCARPWGRGIIRASGARVKVTGIENIDASLPRIYMTNHQSIFDIFALLAFLPVDFKFIMKQELMRIPLFGYATRKAGYIGITREDPRKAIASMNEAAKRIASGSSVLIFPEGTRSTDGVLLPFKKGGFTLAIKSGCDIVPIAIAGSHRIAKKGSLAIKKGSFEMAFGRPITVSTYSKKDTQALMSAVRDAISDLMIEAEKKG